MNILGLTFGHDGAACIVKNGKLVSAVATERLTRKKKDSGVNKNVIDYVLECAGLSPDQIDCVAISDYIKENTNNTLYVPEFENGTKNLSSGQHEEVEGLLFGKKVKVVRIAHHLAHCASAYYTSNYEDSLCFSMDSSFGLIENNSLLAHGHGNKLDTLECPNLITGMGYCIFTEKMGLGDGLHKSGTTMGLACYGEVINQVKDNIFTYLPKMYYDEPQNHKIRNQFERYSISNNYYSHHWSNLWNEFTKTQKQNFRGTSNLAATIQYLLEESLVHTLQNINKKYNQSNNLCLSGGSLLNCPANTKIKNNTSFKHIHHFPACGDDGLAVGAALYVSHHINNEPRHVYENHEIMYLGKNYPLVETPDYALIAKMLSEGKIIGWFMGASEYGPRALGHRSILADPRSYHNREIINSVIKNREWFRPFAPVVMEEHTKNWFDFDKSSPFMLYSVPVLQSEKIPAVTHIDGSARHQTINEKTNKEYYNLIKAFYELTGVPILLNTSFNGKDEPIVETENDAIKSFLNSELDALVLNGKIITK